ncbi:zinc ribbon domain-containing protein [Streptomyces mirabilis]|uniref:zinc ribbon domain-containing protein n=1 Tax=Streptomyces mirabilis TaxID=68239 RepID=UPI0036C9FB03
MGAGRRSRCPAVGGCASGSPAPSCRRRRRSASPFATGSGTSRSPSSGWIEKKSRKSQADFVCVSCGFTCNADENSATNVAAGQSGFPRPRRPAGAGGTTVAAGRSSVREPQPSRVGIPLF